MPLPDVKVYAAGICHSCACAPAAMPREEVEDAVNLLSPTGIDSRWTVAPEPAFATGQPNPCPCNLDPGRIHYLMRC